MEAVRRAKSTIIGKIFECCRSFTAPTTEQEGETQGLCVSCWHGTAAYLVAARMEVRSSPSFNLLRHSQNCRSVNQSLSQQESSVPIKSGHLTDCANSLFEGGDHVIADHVRAFEREEVSSARNRNHINRRADPGRQVSERPILSS